VRVLRLNLGLFGLALATLLGSSGCATLPEPTAERSLYFDLRKVVEVNEDSGWTIDAARLDLNSEPALRSVCQVEPGVRAELARWLTAEIAKQGGPARAQYQRNGGDVQAVATTLSLERTLALLRAAEQRVASDCPFWLPARREFAGEQSDFRRWVVLGETHAFGTVELPGPIPALGGGARVLLGRGISQQLTLAIGAEAAASGTFIPNSDTNGGVDAYLALAAPLLLRVTRFSHLFDVEVAPVVRLSHGQSGWPPGGRVELGYGFSSIRLSPFMSYYMIYVGYEAHGIAERAGLDHTLQLGTKLSVDFVP